MGTHRVRMGGGWHTPPILMGILRCFAALRWPFIICTPTQNLLLPARAPGCLPHPASPGCLRPVLYQRTHSSPPRIITGLPASSAPASLLNPPWQTGRVSLADRPTNGCENGGKCDGIADERAGNWPRNRSMRPIHQSADRPGIVITRRCHTGCPASPTPCDSAPPATHVTHPTHLPARMAS